MSNKRTPQVGEFWRTRAGNKVEVLALRGERLIVYADEYEIYFTNLDGFFWWLTTERQDSLDLIAPWEEPKPEPKEEQIDEKHPQAGEWWEVYRSGGVVRIVQVQEFSPLPSILVVCYLNADGHAEYDYLHWTCFTRWLPNYTFSFPPEPTITIEPNHKPGPISGSDRPWKQDHNSLEEWEGKAPEQFDLGKMWVFYIEWEGHIRKREGVFPTKKHALEYAREHWKEDCIIAIVPYSQTKFYKGEGLND